MLYRRVARPLLFGVAGRDPEAIHERMLWALALASHAAPLRQALALLAAFEAGPAAHAGANSERVVFGLRFPNPIGLAAGFDKNAVAIPALVALGFGFIEIGTITRHTQPGNPRPRLFRLPADQALINRMGFNNQGAEAVAARLARLPRQSLHGAPVGISLGKSKITPLDDAIADYLGSLELLYPCGDYFAINISSPNTPGLRQLQERSRLDALLAALTTRLRDYAISDGRAIPKPLLVKVAPDLDDAALDELLEVCLARGARGLIAVNTTTSREGLSERTPAALRDEAGGLSGLPLQRRALEVVRFLAERADGRLPIIGCGGVFTADDARRFFDAGAALVQLYTGFIYEGPGIARRLARAVETT
ncbi:MAG TPA: quinone-dependent dihydroorotate dehydrogenase, partial [Ktedonobacterales bacterium]|nr:quinone-dependent dihydroorotate dehydrogenase [Ktedonobacterales bacterium]